MRRFALIGVAVIAVAGSSGCASPGGARPDPVVTGEACVSWVEFDTPADAAAEATGVVRGRATELIGTRSRYGEDADVWEVEVERWLHGEGEERIEVLSLPETCGVTYSAGDPLEKSGGEPVILLLREAEGRWETITPYQGVIAPGPDGGIPDAWAE
jgi:hypothetical protein